jgi:HEPN domain-containing protein
MNISEKIKYWVDIAEYDLVTAVAMFETKRYLYVGFMCHQIIEKLLKAYYVRSRNQDPPYTHNLRFLADETGISNEIDEETLLFIISLQPLNIEGRYPTYKESLLKILTDEKCKSFIEKTKEFFEWIKLKL